MHCYDWHLLQVNDIVLILSHCVSLVFFHHIITLSQPTTYTTHTSHLISNTIPFRHSHTDSQRGREFILYRISCYALVLVVDVGCCTACTRLKSVVRTQSQTRAFLAFKYTIGKRLFCVEFEFEFQFQL